MATEDSDIVRLSGRVVKTHSGFFTVETAEGLITCQIAGRLKTSDELTSDLVALNDRVELVQQADGSGTITEVHERTRVLSRVAPSSAVATAAEKEQIIIANCDQAIFVYAAAQPSPQPRMLDRLLVAAEKAEIPSIVIGINKIDLLEDSSAIDKLMAVYAAIGYTVLPLSATTRQGIDTLRELLKGKVSVFTGPSGVGKSSLLNVIQPGLTLQTAEVSEALQKGRHTTRFSQLIKLGENTYLADTPGIRAIAPWDVEPDELDSYFREFRPYVPQCRFTDCSHLHEPGCAVRAAVSAEQISPMRYESYVRLRDELEEQYIYL